MAAAGIWLPARTDSAPPSRPAVGGGAVAGDPVVATEDLGFAYERGAPVLQDIGVAFGAGERVALVGPNGSGKSTLGRLLVGLLRPATGRVRLRGADPSRLPAADLARRAGYVFQDPEAGFLTDTVREEVTLGLAEDERAAVPALMGRLRLSLEEFGTRSPYRLSGGEARRLSLACTLIRRPGLLVLDEPTFGQDRLAYDGLLQILREHVDRGVCLVAATHDERFLADVASRVVTLDAGRIVRDDVPVGAMTGISR
jgi:energy-coupling factor transport system ATP-binding protein